MSYKQNDVVEVSDNHETGQVEVKEVKQYFINDEKFKLLKQYQQLIFEATEVSVALRKIVNEVISIENLEKVRNKIVENLNR